MAKKFRTGDEFGLYLGSGTWASPTWVEIKAVGDLSLDRQPADIEVPVRGQDTGHLQGAGDPQISFTLYDNATSGSDGDTNVQTLVDAIHSGAMVMLAVARGDTSGALTTSTTKYWKMECVLMGVPLSVNRGESASYDVTAKRHANSDNTLTRVTVS